MSIKIKLKASPREPGQNACKGCAYEYDNKNCPRLPDADGGRRRVLHCVNKGQIKGGNYIWIMKETE